jgi:hypothetical protein
MEDMEVDGGLEEEGGSGEGPPFKMQPMQEEGEEAVTLEDC